MNLYVATPLETARRQALSSEQTALIFYGENVVLRQKKGDPEGTPGERYLGVTVS